LIDKKTAEDNSILEVLVGSHSYGTALPTSDHDTKGIFIPPKEYILGLKRYTPQYEYYEYEHVDTFLYSIQKYCKLAAGLNPTVIEMIWGADECILHNTELGKKLIASRGLFNSKLAYKSYGGYAHDQIKRLRNKNGRCGDRHKVVEEHGYDTKHGMHTIRLLNTGIEFLDSGQVNVYRPDAEYLNDIRHGKISYEELINHATGLESILERAYKESDLPDKPDYDGINNLLIEMIEEHWA